MSKIDDRVLREMFEASSVSSFDVSPDTGRIVYARNERSGRTLHLLQKTSSGIYVDTVLSGEDMTYESLRLTKGGNGLIFLSDSGGDERFDIYTADIVGKSGTFALSGARNITPDTDFSVLPPVSLDSRGSKIAFVSNRDGRFAAYLKDIGTLSEQRITDHKYSDNTAVISPDGEKVAVSFSMAGQESGILVYSTQQYGHTIQLKSGNGPFDADSPSWSSDSRHLLFSSSAGEHSRVGSFDIEDGSITWLSDDATDCSTPSASMHGEAVAYMQESETELTPVLTSLSAGVRRSAALRGLCLDMKFTGKGEELVILAETPGNPPNLMMHSQATGRADWLTSSFSAASPADSFTNALPVTYESECDGMRVPALLYEAKGDNGKKAAVVSVHGGPTWKSYDRWDPLVQCLVGAGISVICPNYRGSSGFGRKYRDANRYLMGKADLADCVSARNYLIDSGTASADRIAIMGASFGGYLTMCALTAYPDRWRAGSATVPFLNWFTEVESEREDLRYWDLQNMGDPVNDRERYREASPFFYLDRIRAPVQIIAGANDPRCPPSESLSAKQRLEALGVDLDFRVYEGEGHSFERMENIVDSLTRTYRFISSHLLRN